MDTITIAGVQYTKASVIAREFKYTADYVGQLCRGRKVDARLVGRTWFINRLSLEEHRRQKYSKTTKTVEQAHTGASAHSPSKFISHVSVEPRVAKKTLKILDRASDEPVAASVTYEADEFSLLPRVVKTVAPVSVPILPADARSVRIKRSQTTVLPTELAPEPLPSVVLQGALSVSDIPLDEEVAEESSAEMPAKDTADSPVTQRGGVAALVSKVRKIKINKDISATKPTESVAPLGDVASGQEQENKKSIVPVDQKSSTLTIEEVADSNVHFSPLTVPEKIESVSILYAPTLATSVALVIGMAILSSASVITTNLDSGTIHRTETQLANLGLVINSILTEF